MSSPQGSFIPILIIAMVTWKISGSKRTAEMSSASARQRSSASSRNFRKDSAGSISERLYARNMKQARPAARSSLSNAKRILNKSETGHSKSLARADERESRDRRT